MKKEALYISPLAERLMLEQPQSVLVSLSIAGGFVDDFEIPEDEWEEDGYI